MSCTCCGHEITFENNGLFLRSELFTFEEQSRIEMVERDLCVSCKRELLFANIIAVK